MSSRPNLLVFMPDQLRADCVGCFGNTVVRTPNIDALAARATRFWNTYSQHSVCSPSRVSLMTGWYPHVRGHRTLSNLLKPWEPNLLRILKNAGYTVAHAGLRGDTFATGVTRESTSRFGFSVNPDVVFSKPPHPPEHPLARVFYHGCRKADGVVVDFDEACVRTAEQWLADGLPEPWMLYIPLMFPHPPFEVEEPWYSMHDRAAIPAPAPADLDDKPLFMREIRARYGTARISPAQWAEVGATYYGMIARLDDQLGRVLRAVERTGASERTASFFFTDHGEYLGDYGLVEKWPAGQHECLLRNPLVIHVPGQTEGNVARGFVELIDVFATALELAEIEPQHDHFGRSLVPLLATGNLPHRDAAFSEGGFRLDEEPLFEKAGFPYDLKAGLQHDEPVSVGRVLTIRTADWTLAHRLYERDELYDRRADSRELVNLSGRADLAAVEKGLRDRLLDWLLGTADVIPWDADPRFDTEGAVRPDRPA